MDELEASLARCLDNRALQLILMPTEACNFRCVYCFESDLGGRMEPPVVQGVKKLLTCRVESLRELNLAWFGGEPLLAHDIVTEIMEHARSATRAVEGLSFSSNMTTNGFLLSPPLFRHLVRLGVTEYQITLDGPQKTHDRKRILAGGGATFRRIWDNLLAVRDVGGEFRIMIRLHADRENQQVLPRFIEDYQRAFGRDARFELFIRPISRMGGPQDDCLPVLQGEEARQVVDKLEAHIDQAGIRRMDFEGESQVCHAVRVNSILVRADGRLNKCAVALEHPDNQVGRLHPDGRAELDMPAMRLWMRGLASGDEEELGCPVRGLMARTEQAASV